MSDRGIEKFYAFQACGCFPRLDAHIVYNIVLYLFESLRFQNVPMVGFVRKRSVICVKVRG